MFIYIFFFISLTIYLYLYDILEFIKEFFYKPKNKVDRVIRIQHIIIRSKKYKLGFYEQYILDRELKLFQKEGGDIDYFISGSGSCNIQ